MTNIMLYRECKAIDISGKESQVKVGIEHPECIDGLWSSKLALGIILVDERRAYGVDAWDAAQKAMAMVYLELSFKKLTGWKFLWFEDESSDLTSLLPDFGQSAMNFI